MKQLRFLRFTRSSEAWKGKESKGFAFSLDAAFAVILFISVILVIVSISDTPSSVSTVAVNQLASDLFFTLNKTGFLLTALDTNAPSTALSGIYNESRQLLPGNFDMQLKLTEFNLDEAECRAQQDFAGCFVEIFSATQGSAPPADEGVFKGQRVFVKRQPASDCNASAGLLGTGLQEYFGELFFQSADENFASLVQFDVNTVPAGSIACDQNITVTLSVQIPANVRRPVDMMLVMDRSGSMSWSGEQGSSTATSVFVDRNTAFTGNSTNGVFSFDVNNPLIPTLKDSDDPGTVLDIHGKQNYVFAADTSGTDEVYPYNTTNPSNIQRLAAVGFESTNGVFGVFVDGSYLYVAGDRTVAQAGAGSNGRGLYIFDISNPNSISQAGKLDVSNISDVFVDGNIAYVARLGSGVSTMDVANKSAPAIMSTVNPGGTSEGVYKDGNFLYVASGDSGLSVVNVSNPGSISVAGTLTAAGTGTAYSYNVFKAGNEAYIANGTSLYIVNVSTPSSPVFARSYASPYNYRDIYIKESYAFLASIQHLVTVDIFNGPRIDNAKLSATNFVDFNGWKFPGDQIGLASFNTVATLDQQLTSDGNAVKPDINALVANGGTNIQSGIDTATTELISARHNPNALRFQVLLSDGQSNSGNSALAAQTAAGYGIKIYTIAYGADADVNELQTIADITDGNFYLATDQNALAEVFRLISFAIAETAQDSNVVVGLGSGEFAVDTGVGVIDLNTIVFDLNELQPGVPWVASYVVNFPCNLAANCNIDAVTFPGSGTTFNYIDSNGVSHTIDFNASTTLTFLNRDLSVDVFAGEVVSDTEVLLDVNVSNIGDLNSGPTVLNFYLNDLNGPLLETENVPALCGAQDASCNYFPFELYYDVDVGSPGLIYAVVNDDNSVRECPLNNSEAVYCLSSPKTQYYLLEYWAWRK